MPPRKGACHPEPAALGDAGRAENVRPVNNGLSLRVTITGQGRAASRQVFHSRRTYYFTVRYFMSYSPTALSYQEVVPHVGPRPSISVGVSPPSFGTQPPNFRAHP